MNEQERINKVNTLHNKFAELYGIEFRWILSMRDSLFKPIPDRVLSLLQELYDLAVEIKKLDTQQQEVD